MVMNCNYFSEIKYKEFAEPINRKLLHERIPIEGTIELTHRCNLKCVHCYCSQAADNNQIKNKELSLSDICKILDDIAERGCLWLLLTGGEPLLRDDFLDIYTYAKKKGFLITLFTNATLVTSKIADFFKEWPPYKVEVTLYGASKSTYEKITGVQGSFEKCMEGIHALLERNISLHLKAMVTTLNKHELWDIKKFAKSLNLDFRFDPLLHPRIDDSRTPCKYRITPREVVELDLKDCERLKEWKRILKEPKDFIKFDSLYLCGAGRTSFFINPYGEMSICSLTLKPSYNIKENSFDKIWNIFFPEILNREYNKDFLCRNCELEFYCPTCPGWGMIENGDPESIVDYLCEIAHMRKEAFDNIIDIKHPQRLVKITEG